LDRECQAMLGEDTGDPTPKVADHLRNGIDIEKDQVVLLVYAMSI